jgi:hypothetical protein
MMKKDEAVASREQECHDDDDHVVKCAAYCGGYSNEDVVNDEDEVVASHDYEGHNNDYHVVNCAEVNSKDEAVASHE